MLGHTLITTYPIIPPLDTSWQLATSLPRVSTCIWILKIPPSNLPGRKENSEDCIEATWLTKPIMSSFVFALYKNAFTLWVRKPVGNSLKFLYQSVRVNHRGVILTLKQALLIDSILESCGVVWIWNPNSAFIFLLYIHMHTCGRHSYTPYKILIPKVQNKFEKLIENENHHVFQKVCMTWVGGHLLVIYSDIVFWI